MKTTANVQIVHGALCELHAFTALSFTGTGAHANIADNIWNEGITGGVENAVPLHVNIFRNCFVKNTRTTIFLALTAHQTPTFTGWLQKLCCLSSTRL
jgi:hypothetical protein